MSKTAHSHAGAAVAAGNIFAEKRLFKVILSIGIDRSRTQRYLSDLFSTFS